MSKLTWLVVRLIVVAMVTVCLGIQASWSQSRLTSFEAAVALVAIPLLMGVLQLIQYLNVRNRYSVGMWSWMCSPFSGAASLVNWSFFGICLTLSGTAWWLVAGMVYKDMLNHGLPFTCAGIVEIVGCALSQCRLKHAGKMIA